MRYELFDYQRAAAVDCVRRLVRAREDMTKGYRSSFALSAITGSGKTVIATAAIEAMLHGSADLEVDADPRACFLWVTDDPALNKQTRNKMWQASDLLNPAQLQIIENNFMDSELSPGRVYFLNIQKLSKNAGLAQGGRNTRQYSMWDVLKNTIEGGRTDLYLVLDEAHRGMKPARDRKSIVQRIISGQPGANPPVPAVWGISATIDRFTEAMKGVTDRTEYPPVQVDIDKVRASGLVKDEIGLDEPDESGTFSTTLLREAVKTLLDFEKRWADYSATQNEPSVAPVMVVQVPDKASDDKLSEIVEVIESGWSGLAGHAIVHVFGEHETLNLSTRAVRWVPPESIQGDSDVRVVLAKEAISTGWDCPRAEVLYSERPANDATHIAQVVGRMVRQPLAHRIATDDVLNSVACFLPYFNRSALGVIKAELEGNGAGAADVTTGAEVVRRPAVFERSTSIPAEVFDFIETLPSIPAPDSLVSPLRRARLLAKLLTDDASGSAMLPGAGRALTKILNAKLDGLAAEYADQVAVNVEDLKTTDIHRSRVDATGKELAPTSRQIVTHIADLDRDTRRLIRSLKEGAGMDYYKHRAHKAGEGADRLEIRTEIAALIMIPDTAESLDAAATKWVRARLDDHAVAIKNTTGATRDAFQRVQEQTITPEAVTIALRDNLSVATVDGDGAPLSTFEGHIYSDSEGLFPAALNSWETDVIRAEASHDSFVGWYRNPSRATPAALRIAYKNDAGTWTSVQPDFIVASRRDDGSLAASIIDPHGDHFADARNKLLALADYAENHGDQFVRIESITKTGDELRYLDLTDEAVRDRIRSFEGAEVASLYESDVSSIYHAAE
jgi:type III restriction enzyme